MIEDVVKTAAEMANEAAAAKAEQNRIETEKKAYEAAHPTCKTSWKHCADNADMANNYKDWVWSRTACVIAANSAARFGKPKWPWIVFSKFVQGTDGPQTGKVTLIDDTVQFQNAFGTYGRTRVVCS